MFKPFQSSIFSIINTDLEGIINKIKFLNRSFSDILNAYKFGDTNGGLKGFVQGIKAVGNSMSKGISKTDLANIKEYNSLLAQKIDSQTAWYRTMQTSSKTAQDLVINANGEAVALDKVSTSANTSKIAMIGLKAITVATNMALMAGISWLISKGIQGLDYLIHYQANAAKAAKETAEASREQVDAHKENIDTIDELIVKYKELKESYDNSGKTDENIKSEILDIQSQFISFLMFLTILFLPLKFYKIRYIFE